MNDENTKVVNEKVNEEENEKQEIILINEETIQSKIYIVRGQKVMLDVDLATKQSRALVRTFKQMKDYILENQGLINQRDYLQLSLVVAEHSRDINAIKSSLNMIDQVKNIMIDIL